MARCVVFSRPSSLVAAKLICPLQFIQGEVTAVAPTSATVRRASGATETISGNYVVLATGSSYPAPMKVREQPIDKGLHVRTNSSPLLRLRLSRPLRMSLHFSAYRVPSEGRTASSLSAGVPRLSSLRVGGVTCRVHCKVHPPFSAGEIKAARPNATVTLLHSGPTLLAGAQNGTNGPFR